jgi:type I restriction enzyme M protein
MILHGLDVPASIRRGNALSRPLRNYGPADRVDIVVTNPPFGGIEEPGIEQNFPTNVRTRETADLFLILIMRLLKPGGRAGIILPDGTLFGEGVKTRIKENFLKECDLHTIVRIPGTAFAPYTPIATNLLFFTKGSPTKEVWYYEHRLPEGFKAYSKTKPILSSEFAPERDWWNARSENGYAWRVTIDEIKARDYNLDIRNPTTSTETQQNPHELMKVYRQKQESVAAAIDDIRALLQEILRHHAL